MPIKKKPTKEKKIKAWARLNDEGNLIGTYATEINAIWSSGVSFTAVPCTISYQLTTPKK